ncbi:hypothetical protein QF035_006690 [Streptomyces umbrinus]|uniref:Uncharacterized protein n=1 Tax=Streptomyces umbrinus TaxID=67370 RepID=A0ABU0T083_9ACTN|nr:hypothetical protein [Streptomyces umbrinus]MDQ1029108.1 hypothetical protein [Streptomyces umbrinus]
MADHVNERGDRQGVPVPQIAQKLVITSGKNKGQSPSVAARRPDPLPK